MRKKRILGLWTTGSLFGVKFALTNSDYRLRVYNLHYFHRDFKIMDCSGRKKNKFYKNMTS